MVQSNLMSKSPRSPTQRARAIARGIGGCLGFVFGIVYGAYVLQANPGAAGTSSVELRAALLLFACAGAASLALAAPLITVDVFLWLQEFLDTAPAGEIFGAVVGLVSALAIAAFMAIVLSGLPLGIGFIVSVSMAGALGYIGVRTGRRRRQAFTTLFQVRGAAAASVLADSPDAQDGAPIVVDTSALIDGRIVDVVKTGFIQGRLVVPTFVLEELQSVADSADTIKRSRGRRGLAAVDVLKQGDDVVCEILELDFPGTPEVDAKLIKLARLRGASLMTQDYNLNRLAQIEGLRVLNLNDLANALKPIASSGETIKVTVVKEGKEPNQGIGYLEDGTMVVVEGGRGRIDETVNATVASVLQTAAGRMIFAQARDDDDDARGGRSRSRSPRAADR